MRYLFLVLGLVFIPVVTNAEVIFSEIAWMGTEENANNEWIEIYNFGSEMTDLTGWTISDGNSLSIELSGMMTPHGVFLLERTDDTTVPGIDADIIYTGALTNSGATLTIKDAGGQAVGSPLVGGGDWVNIGGNNEYKYTAQLTMTGTWVTGTATPGMPNIEEDTHIPDGGDDDGDDDDTSSDTPTKSSSGSSSSSSKTKTPVIAQKLNLAVTSPKIVYVNQEVPFEAIPTGVGKATKNSLKYMWNFGDTNTSDGKSTTHIFKYPGEYVVVTEAKFAKQIAQARQEVKVIQSSFTLTRDSNGDVVLTNKSTNEVDLHDFTLKGLTSFSFPRMSILKAGGSITIPKEKLGTRTSSLSFYDTQNTSVATLSTHQIATSPASPVYKRPQYAPQVAGASTDSVIEKIKTKMLEKSEEATSTSAPKTIRIGDNDPVELNGFLSRLFQKLGSIFNI